jgi:hypothetical protein
MAFFLREPSSYRSLWTQLMGKVKDVASAVLISGFAAKGG